MDLDLLLQLLISCVVVCHCSDARCLYGDGADCFYKCHCLDKTECGGSCTSGCDTAALGYNWGGPTCQTGNVALGKRAGQEGGCCGAHASGAVDGLIQQLPATNSHLERCAHPTENGGHWWVELGGIYMVYSVTIYFRLDCASCTVRNSRFTISVRNSSTESAVCAYQHDEVTDPIMTFMCSTSLVGREVDFIRDGSGYISAALCEVIVTGHQYTDCSRCPGECNDVTGCLECDGSYQPECKQECDHSYYGRNCLSSCGRCNGNVACDKSSGICSEGCKVWWITDKCQVEIVEAVPDNATIDVQEITNSSISVSWRKVNVSDNTAHHYGYRVRATQNGTQNYAVEERVKHQGYNGLFKISALRYNTYYILLVTPYRMWGNTTNMGTPYTTITQKTHCANPEKPTHPDITVTTVSSGGALQITHQNISSINSKCNAITAAWLSIYIDEDAIASIVLNMEDIANTFPLHESGSYKALITITNNEGLISNSDFSTTIWYGTTTAETYKPGYGTTATNMYMPDGDGNSIVIPWAMFGVALAIVTALIIAIVVIIINQKRQIEKLKQQIRGRQPATGDQDQGSDVHLDEIHMKPDRSVHGQGHDLPASPPQTQSHDQADYEEVGTDMVAPPDISHQKGAVNPDDGSGQYEDLRGGIYGNSQITGPYEMMSA